VYSENILIANFGLDADNSLMNAPKKMPYNGSIPHNCVHFQKEPIKLKTRRISRTFLVTEYVFQADGMKAIQAAAADGCAFWQFFIRDFLDKDGRSRRPDMYVPSQCSFTTWFYGEEKSKRERAQKRAVSFPARHGALLLECRVSRHRYGFPNWRNGLDRKG
jgi:hypothetical protein